MAEPDRLKKFPPIGEKNRTIPRFLSTCEPSIHHAFFRWESAWFSELAYAFRQTEAGATAEPLAPLPAAKLQTQYEASPQDPAGGDRQSPAAGERAEGKAVQDAREAVKKAQAEADAAQKELGKINGAKALVDHAKGKWIGGAEKGIAQAEAALKKATTAAEREAAKKDLAKWQANKEDGLKALKERQAAYDKAKIRGTEAAQGE